jgi:hypothetical protein
MYVCMYKVVQIWPGQTVTCLHTNSPGHIWTTLYVCVYVCVYVCMYVCMYVCVHVCMSMYVYVCICTYVCVCLCICVCVYICVCMYFFIYLYLLHVPLLSVILHALLWLQMQLKYKYSFENSNTTQITTYCILNLFCSVWWILYFVEFVKWYFTGEYGKYFNMFPYYLLAKRLS